MSSLAQAASDIANIAHRQPDGHPEVDTFIYTLFNQLPEAQRKRIFKKLQQKMKSRKSDKE